MNRRWMLLLCGLATAPGIAGELPAKAASYHAALLKRPESVALFQRFRDAWLEERPAAELERELLSRAEAGDAGAWAVLGRERLMEGKEAEAAEAFAKALAADPGAAWLHLERAKLLLAAKDFPAAEKEAVAVAEGSAQRAEALKLAGLACLRDERVEEALAHWAAAVKAGAGDQTLLEELTELTRREGRLDLALDYCGQWRDAMEDPYAKAMATLQRASLLLEARKFDAAIAELGQVLASSGDGSWLEREAISRARQAYERQAGTQAGAVGWMGKIGEWAAANPTRLELRRAQATALADAGKAHEALAALMEVLRRRPGDREVRWQRVALLVADGQPEAAFEECAALAAEEKTEAAGLQVAELAFQLEKREEVRKALDGVLAVADPAKAVALAGLYARYGMPQESEKRWREMAGGEQGGQALRELAGFLRAAGRSDEELAAWRALGQRAVAADRIEAAQVLAARGLAEEARELLERERARFAAEPGYESARAELAMLQGRRGAAQEIYRALAGQARRAAELSLAVQGWLRTVARDGDDERVLQPLGAETGDRCLRAAWLAEHTHRALPALVAGDELERELRLALLREQRRWPEVIALLEQEATPSLTTLRELAEAKAAAGDGVGALQAVKLWRERMPEQPEAWLKEAELLTRNGEPGAAEILLRRATSRFEDHEELARRFLELLKANRNGTEAQAYAWQRYDRATEQAAKNLWLGEILKFQPPRGPGDPVREKLEERARRDPAAPGPLLALAEWAKARGDARERRDFLRRAVAAAPREVAILGALAAAEEQVEGPAQALPRYAEIARLAPGPAAARQWAMAKIRGGDFAGGVRDLVALAGEKGLDLQELEDGARAIASEGRVEEAIELLEGVPAEELDARRHFLLARLQQADGREAAALEHYLKVIGEPADPAEALNGWSSSLAVLFSPGQDDAALPASGPLPLGMPPSLSLAKQVAKRRALDIALALGDTAWNRLQAMAPFFQAASREDWRRVVDFAAAGAEPPKWWDFLERYPEHPLALELIESAGQEEEATPWQIRTLLTAPRAVPPGIGLTLLAGSAELPAGAEEWLAKLAPGPWQEPKLAERAILLTHRCLMAMERTDPPADRERRVAEICLSKLAGVKLAGDDARSLRLLQARSTLLVKGPGAAQALEQALAPGVEGKGADLEYGFARLSHFVTLFRPALQRWSSGKTAEERAALIEGISAPLTRGIVAIAAGEPDAGGRIGRELAALPAGGDPRIQRGLIRLRWLLDSAQEDPAAYRQELAAAMADDADPRLAMDALLQLSALQATPQQPWSQAWRERHQQMVERLAQSADEEDRRYVSSARQAASFAAMDPAGAGAAATAPATRWGQVLPSSPAASLFPQAGQGRQPEAEPELERLMAEPDRALALRKLATWVEAGFRSARRGDGRFTPFLVKLRQKGVLDEVLALLKPPGESSGLHRRVAWLQLMDDCFKGEGARRVVADLHRRRPWDCAWTLELAFRTENRAARAALLDEAAQARGFDRELVRCLFRKPAPEGALGTLMRLNLLADWAEQAEGERPWLGKVVALLGAGSGPGLERLRAVSGGQVTEPRRRQAELFRRFLALALADRRAAEPAFRTLGEAGLEPEEVVAAAARQVLLGGGYREDSATAFEEDFLPQQQGQPSALEYLVGVAETGDEIAFPADFRQRLQAVDPALAGWLERLTTAREAKEVPDVTNFAARFAAWPQRARHGAAVLRLRRLPGRDEFLRGLFGQPVDTVASANLEQVVRASLLEAAGRGALPERMRTFLEAAAGPRAGWAALEEGPRQRLSAWAQLLVRSMGKGAGSTALRATVQCLVEDGIATQPLVAGQALGNLWRAEWQAGGELRQNGLGEIPLEELLKVGSWGPDPSGDRSRPPVYRWELLIALQPATPYAAAAAFQAQVKANSLASMADLLAIAASAGQGSGACRQRLLRELETELAKAPEPIRRGVVEVLTGSMTAEDVAELPAYAAAPLQERLEAARRLRSEQIRRDFETIQSRNGLDGGVTGRLAAMVLAEDPPLVEEIVEKWVQLQGKAGVKAAEMAQFTTGLMAERPGKPALLFQQLALVEKAGRSVGEGVAEVAAKAFERAWQVTKKDAFLDPEFWRAASQASPWVQARFFAADMAGLSQARPPAPEVRATLLEAAGASALGGRACAWWLLAAEIGTEPAARVDGRVLLDFLRELKATGLTPAELVTPVAQAYRYLPRLIEPAELVKETPLLLAEVGTLERPFLQAVIEGAQALWPAQPKGGPAADPAVRRELLAFLLERIQPGDPGLGLSLSLSRLVIDCQDPALLQRWLEVGGDGLKRDLVVILELLRQGRPEAAVALAPGPGEAFRQRTIPFTQELAGRLGPLRQLDTPAAKRLAMNLSLLPDAREGGAPVEPWVERRRRLAADFERQRAELAPAERLAAIVALGLHRQALTEHRAELDEFAGEDLREKFLDYLAPRSPASPDRGMMEFYVAVACSRLHAEDPAALAMLAAAIRQKAPDGGARLAAMRWTPLMLASCWIYADRHDGQLPPAVREAFRNVADSLKGGDGQPQPDALMLLRLAADSPAEAAREVERRLGSKNLVFPGGSWLWYYQAEMALSDPELARLQTAMRRLSVVHPAATEAWAEGVDALSGRMSFATLKAFGDARVRAAVRPARALGWLRAIRGGAPPGIEGAQRYRAERAADFSGKEQEEWDRLMAPLAQAASIRNAGGEVPLPGTPPAGGPPR